MKSDLLTMIDNLLLGYYNYDSFLFPFRKQQSFMLCLNAFKEADVFKDLSWLFHNDGSVYDKALKP